VSFWHSQPVCRPTDDLRRPGEITPPPPNPTATPLPAGLRWELPTTEDASALLRAHSSPTLAGRLHHAAVLGIRQGSALVGCVSATPARIRVRRATLSVAVVDALCLAASHQGAGLTPLLITELLRLLHSRGVRQALAVIARPLPALPLVTLPVYHRALAPARLREHGWEVDDEPPLTTPAATLRPAQARDAPQILDLLTQQSAGKALATLHTIADIERGILAPGAHTLLCEGVGAARFRVWRAGPVRLARIDLLVARREPAALLAGVLAAASRAGADMAEALGTGRWPAAMGRAGMWRGPESAPVYLHNWRVKPLAPRQVALTLL